MRAALAEAGPDPSVAAAERGGRRLFVDNLRWTMIVLVIGMHAADTYSPFGSWYFTDRAGTDRLTTLALATFQSVLQAFFMGVLFAVAGYFARASLLRKGRAAFLRDRAIRLGAPTLLYMLAIGPLTEYYVAGSWRSSRPTSFAAQWLHHIADGEVLSESGPLWFCVVLLIFSAVLALARGAAASRPAASTAGDPSAGDPGLGDPRAGSALALVLAMAAATFVARLVFPSGATVLNLPLGDLPQYAAMFIVGLDAHRRGWVDRLSVARGCAWGLAAVLLGAAGWVALVALGGALAGDFAPYGGGWTWQAAAKALWEAWLCVSLSLALIALFRARFDRQGRPARILSANAFAVYVIHPPILIAVTRLLALWPGPSAVKFLAAWILGGAASFAFAALVVRRVPLLRQLL
jgi:hypothetical protein